MEPWKLLLVVAVSAGLVARVASLWPGFPPPRHWRLRARVAVWVGFAAATGLLAVFVAIVWSLSEASGA